MQVELEWGEGISILIDLPREIRLDEYLGVVEELEFMIKRWDDTRQQELHEELERLKQEHASPLDAWGPHERALFEEFLRWKQQRLDATDGPPAATRPSQDEVQRHVDAKLAALEQHSSRALDVLGRG